jgi:pyruvate dehydrogenase E2 component (dihydrolipoamide acetyltransferase)
MATEFRLPDVGENVETGQVVKLLVSVGDAIQPDQSVLELETDKAVIEVPVPMGGIVNELFVKEGEEIKVGQLILTLTAVPEEADEAKPAPPPSTPAAQPVVEPQPSAHEASAQDLADLEVSSEATQAPVETARPPAARAEPPPETLRSVAPAAPSVRRLARELGVDINQVSGSGPGGRISSEDVKGYVRQYNLEAQRARRHSGAIEAPSLPDFTKWGEIVREPMTSVRRTTARRLSQAWTTIPHVTHFDQADITHLETLRKRYAHQAEDAGGKLTVTAIILKVVATALKVFPKFNASVDVASQEIIYRQYCHIGVAVDTERGLLVPVIHNADRKNIIELSVELTQISEKARSSKVSLEDLEGSTFTVTNLGGIGGTNFAPIINPPEVAILGISRASTQPIFNAGGFEPRLIMPLSLSYDHRLIDGADAARFMRWVAQAIEQPFLLSLEG